MENKRILNFSKPIPDTYKLFKDKVSVLNRRVLTEKVEPSDESSVFKQYFASYMEMQLSIEQGNQFLRDLQNKTAEFDKPKVLIEKDLKLIKLRKQKLEARKQFIDNHLTINIKSKPEEITSDITSLENIDFYGPVTKEQKKELKEILDQYMYRDCIDEINCDIKERDKDGVDVVRMNYGQHSKDMIASDLNKVFTEQQSERLDENYMNSYFRQVDYKLSRILKRNVLIEKKGHQFFKTKNWERLGFITLRNYLDSVYRQMEYQDIVGEIHRRINTTENINFQ